MINCTCLYSGQGFSQLACKVLGRQLMATLYKFNSKTELTLNDT